MTSIRQHDANRRNAARSTGPTSAAGRARSSRNATRHGLFAKGVLLPTEDRAAFEATCAALFVEHAPVGVLETHLVERLALNLLRQERLARYEAARLRDTAAEPVNLHALGQRLDLNGPAPDYYVDGPAPDAQAVELARAALQELESRAGERRGIKSLGDVRRVLPAVWRALEARAATLGISVLEHAGQTTPETRFDPKTGSSHWDAPATVQKFLDQEHEALWLVDFHARERSRIRRAIAALRASAVGRAALDERLTRYQAELDNEMRRLLRQLHELQRARLIHVDARGAGDGASAPDAEAGAMNGTTANGHLLAAPNT